MPLPALSNMATARRVASRLTRWHTSHVTRTWSSSSSSDAHIAPQPLHRSSALPANFMSNRLRSNSNRPLVQSHAVDVGVRCSHCEAPRRCLVVRMRAGSTKAPIALRHTPWHASSQLLRTVASPCRLRDMGRTGPPKLTPAAFLATDATNQSTNRTPTAFRATLDIATTPPELRRRLLTHCSPPSPRLACAPAGSQRRVLNSRRDGLYTCIRATSPSTKH